MLQNELFTETPREISTQPAENATATLFTVVSYFSGCGGLDLGFKGDFEYKGEKLEKLPFNILAAYDKDQKCVKTYNDFFGEDCALVKELTETSASEAPKAEVLVGGFPCQDFSSCGPKTGLASNRGQAYKSLIGYMRLHEPKVVVAENVPHIARMGKGAVMRQILEEFNGAGYTFDVWNLNAAEYGVPQSRKRVFFIGVKNGIEGFPAKPPTTHELNLRSIDWAIEDLEAVTDESITNQSQYFRANLAKNGNRQGDETNRKGELSYTIRANAKSRIQFHYSLPRRLTIRECARLQTFPDNFNFPYHATTNIMQIGNAVPPLLGHHVARSIAAFLKTI